ncbi:MAG: GNAT family N-acetyltransferase [Rhizobiaceae bacterium]
MTTTTKIPQTGAPKTGRTAKVSVSIKQIGTSAGIEGTTWVLEILDKGQLSAISGDIGKLADKCGHTNPFFELPFLLPASKYLGEDKIEYLCLHEYAGNHRALKMFAPVTVVKIGIGRSKVLRLWSHPYAPLSTPLFDITDPVQATLELVNCLESATAEYADAILFENLPKISGFSRLIHSEPRLSDRLIRFSQSSRGSIIGKSGLRKAVSEVTGKRRQRLRKATERLEASGKVSFEIDRDLAGIGIALLKHLELEDRCWKGNRGTSILKSDAATAFTENAVKGMAAQNQCRIHSLKLDGNTIASMILFQADGHYFPWKIAFDESLARFSVGNLLLSHVNEHITQDKAFVMLDSLASELNETAKRFWPDSLELNSMVIGLGPKGPQTAYKIASELDLLSRAKLSIKKWLGRSL